MLTDALTISLIAVGALILPMFVFARLYWKTGPHEALVVYGFAASALSGATAPSFCRWSKIVANCRWS